MSQKLKVFKIKETTVFLKPHGFNSAWAQQNIFIKWLERIDLSVALERLINKIDMWH